MAEATSSKGKNLGSPVAEGWPQRELQHLSGIDPRLVRRLAIMLEDWAAQPQASIPEGSRSKAAVKASYRLLSNKRLKAADIAQSHREATEHRRGGALDRPTRKAVWIAKTIHRQAWKSCGEGCGISTT